MRSTAIWGTLGINALALGIGISFALHPSASAHPAGAPSADRASMVIVSSIKLGGDRKLHDAFTPAIVAGTVGRPLTVTVYNYDTDPHTRISVPLHLQVLVRGAARGAQPAATTFTFTPTRAGTYTWRCTRPCDSESKGWAMGHMGYMSGGFAIRPA